MINKSLLDSFWNQKKRLDLFGFFWHQLAVFYWGNTTALFGIFIQFCRLRSRFPSILGRTENLENSLNVSQALNKHSHGVRRGHCDGKPQNSFDNSESFNIIFDFRKSNDWKCCVSNSMKVKTLRQGPRPKRVWSPFKIPLTGWFSRQIFVFVYHIFSRQIEIVLSQTVQDQCILTNFYVFFFQLEQMSNATGPSEFSILTTFSHHHLDQTHIQNCASSVITATHWHSQLCFDLSL